MLYLLRPYSPHCNFGSGLLSVPLELSGQKESRLRYASKTNYRTENYHLARHVLENGLAALQVNLDEIQVELSASRQQHIMQLYCSKHLNNAFGFFWKAMGLAYANCNRPAWATRTGLQEPYRDRAFARRRRKCQSGIRTEKERERLCVTLFCGCLFIINSVLGILLVVVDMSHGGVPKSPNCPRL